MLTPRAKLALAAAIGLPVLYYATRSAASALPPPDASSLALGSGTTASASAASTSGASTGGVTGWIAPPRPLTGAMMADPATRRDVITAMQSELLALGYNPGTIDGVWGANTLRAAQSWLNAQGTPFDYTSDANDVLARLALKIDDAYNAAFPSTA